ncbi:hypothetical protein [uncultured Helicobacter sp.]|uniref:hypothetical protein n=1 Tax=uncultured Helicobacter sp. TaxID=175537 RepID=UPI00261FF774|nr:hypothetical protein [uncultured Helicobacter sp.]
MTYYIFATSFITPPPLKNSKILYFIDFIIFFLFLLFCNFCFRRGACNAPLCCDTRI